MRKLSTLVTICLVLFGQRVSTDYSEFVETYDESELTTESLFNNSSNEDFRNIFSIDNEIPNHARDQLNTTTSDDIIVLNVGGQRIVTYRSTLTAVPYSKLALMFAKNNKTKLARNVVHFFDYNPQHFQYLLDQLRNLKYMPQVPGYELSFSAPKDNQAFNFSIMLSELGLNSDRFLSPLLGTHVNLKVSSLVGWKLCYRGKYDTPFDDTVLKKTCMGKRLLVACRKIIDRKTLIVAGIGRREKVFERCNPNSYCTPSIYNGTGFYYSENYAWGFEGQPIDSTNRYQQNINGYYNGQRGSIQLNPCDNSDQNSEHRLCWSLRSLVGRGGGDRCGSSKNLHNTHGWERVIYQAL